MGRLSNVKPVEVKVRLEDYIHLVLGVKKVGKTTLFRDLINKHYNGDMTKGFLAGFEKGFQALDGLYAAKIKNWDDWEEYVDEFVSDKKNIPYKFIAIDTIDYMVMMAKEKTMKDSKKKDGKKVTSLNDAFGGFARGKEYCINLIRASLDKLQTSDYGIFLIGHTKLKKKNTGVVLGDGQEFMQLSCNLTDDFAGVFEEMADMITYLVLDREADLSVEDAKQRTSKSSVSMRFRSDGEIDCGGRFTDLPASLPYSAENYLKAFTQGVKSSILKPVTDTQIKEMAEKQETESAEELKENPTQKSIEDMVAEVKKEFPNLGDGAKLVLQQLIEEAEILSLDELTEEHRDVVEKMYELVS